MCFTDIGLEQTLRQIVAQTQARMSEIQTGFPLHISWETCAKVCNKKLFTSFETLS